MTDVFLFGSFGSSSCGTTGTAAMKELGGGARVAGALARLGAIRRARGGDDAYAPLLLAPPVLALLASLGRGSAERVAAAAVAADLTERCRAASFRLADSSDRFHHELLGWRVWNAANRAHLAKPARTPLLDAAQRTLVGDADRAVAAVLRQAFDIDASAHASHARVAESALHAAYAGAAPLGTIASRGSTPPSAAAARAKRSAKKKAQRVRRREQQRRTVAVVGEAPPPTPSRGFGFGCSVGAAVAWAGLLALALTLVALTLVSVAAAPAMLGTATATASLPPPAVRPPVEAIKAVGAAPESSGWGSVAFHPQIYAPLSTKVQSAAGTFTVLAVVGLFDVAAQRGGIPAAARAALVALMQVYGARAEDAFTITGNGVSTTSSDDQCISDGAGNYDSSESATMTAAASGIVYTKQAFGMSNLWDMDTSGDWLMIHGKQYGGNPSDSGVRNPTGVVIATGDVLTWKTKSWTGGQYAGFTLCLCATTGATWNAFVNGACTAFTSTTCPANHWGDTVNSKCAQCGVGAKSPAGSTAKSACVCDPGYWGTGDGTCTACDATLGRSPIVPLVVGAAAEIAACEAAAFSIADPGQNEFQKQTTAGVEYAGPLCVTDGMGAYERSEKATIVAKVAGEIYTTGTFATYEPDDYLEVYTGNGAKSKKYSQSTPPPAGTLLAVGDTVTWQTKSQCCNRNDVGSKMEGFTLCMCETVSTWKALVDGSCLQFTSSTCPANYWGDAVTSTCVRCVSGTSPAGSTAMLACVCDAGFWGTGDGTCTACDATQGRVSEGGGTAATEADLCTCAAGYWGTTACTACDATANRVGNGKIGEALESDACKAFAFTFATDTGILSRFGDCIVDGIGTGGSGVATVTAPLGGVLYTIGIPRSSYSAYYNYIEVAATQYDGSAKFPDGLVLAPGGTFQWDEAVYGGAPGFGLCICETGAYRALSTTTGRDTTIFPGNKDITWDGYRLDSGVKSSLICTPSQTPHFCQCGLSSGQNGCCNEGRGECPATLGASVQPDTSISVCSAYSASTCPAGFWGDATNTLCVACAIGKTSVGGASSTSAAACVCIVGSYGPPGGVCTMCDVVAAGRVAKPGVVGAQTESAACTNSAFSKPADGVVRTSVPLASMDCISDGVGNYAKCTAGNNAACLVTLDVAAGTVFTTGEFATGSKQSDDALIIKDTRYYGIYSYSNAGMQEDWWTPGMPVGGPDAVDVGAGGPVVTWSYKNNDQNSAGFTLCHCDTTIPYTIVVDRTCKTFTQSTCPADYWADATTQSCTKCVNSKSAVGSSNCICNPGYWGDGPASATPGCSACVSGKYGAGAGVATEALACTSDCPAPLVGNTLVGKASMSDACTNVGLVVTTGSGLVVAGTETMCVTDAPVSTNQESATVAVAKQGKVYTTRFTLGSYGWNAENKNDYLLMNGVYYSGGTPPPTGMQLNVGDTFTWRRQVGLTVAGFELCLCDTSSGFRVVSDGACTAYSSATCPAGTWATTSSTCELCPNGKYGTNVGMQSEATACTSCPSPSKWGNTKLGQTSEADACTDTAFAITGTKPGVVVADDKMCITDGAGNYELGEAAAITAMKGGIIYTTGTFKTTSLDCWSTGKGDFFLIGANLYGGDPTHYLWGFLNPTGVAIAEGQSFTWQSNNACNQAQEGFTLCLCLTQGTYNVWIDSASSSSSRRRRLLDSAVGTATGCTAYTQSTCPANYWGDATTSSCVKCVGGTSAAGSQAKLDCACKAGFYGTGGDCTACDASAGRASNGVVGAATEGDGCAGASFSFTGTGVTYAKGAVIDCISSKGEIDGAYSANYDPNADATMTVTISGELYLDGLFKTGGSRKDNYGNDHLDYLSINSAKYMNEAGPPSGLSVVAGDALAWKTSYFFPHKHRGFRLCLCQTVGTYKVLEPSKGSKYTDGLCTQYTQSTCPANYWGNAATSSCVKCIGGTSAVGSTAKSACSCKANYYGSGGDCTKCNSNVGRTGNGLLNQASEALACHCAAGFYGTSTCIACAASKIATGKVAQALESDACKAFAFAFAEDEGIVARFGDCIVDGIGQAGGEVSLITAPIGGTLYIKGAPRESYVAYYDYIEMPDGTQYPSSNALPSGLTLIAGDTLKWKTATFGGAQGFALCLCEQKDYRRITAALAADVTVFSGLQISWDGYKVDANGVKDANQKICTETNSASSFCNCGLSTGQNGCCNTGAGECPATKWVPGATQPLTVVSTCTVFTASTCPAGTWANAATTQCEECAAAKSSPIGSTEIGHCVCAQGYWGIFCTACDTSLNRVGKLGVYGASTEEEACKDAAFIIVGTGMELVPGKDCITDGAGKYLPMESATATLNNGVAGTLYTTMWELPTQTTADYIQIGGTNYAGPVKPSGVKVASGAELKWSTSWGNNYNGFEVCLCNTNVNYQVVVLGNPDQCVAYTATTCPTGYFSDTTQQVCIACNAAAGLVPKSGSGHSSVTDACTQSVFAISGSGVAFDAADSNCVTTPTASVTTYMYNNGVSQQVTFASYRAAISQTATITILEKGTIFLKPGSSFGADRDACGASGCGNFLNPQDYLELKGNKFTDTIGPESTDMAAGDTFAWFARSNNVSPGTNPSCKTGTCHAGFTICHCDTQSQFQLITTSGCEMFSETSCPVGYWGDSTTSTCVECNSALGRAGKPGVTGRTNEAEACQDAPLIFTGTGVSFVPGMFNCVTDGPGKYGPNEMAVITANTAGNLYTIGVISTNSADLEYVTIKGVQYGGPAAASPNGITVEKYELMGWTTYVGGGAGFTLCICPVADVANILTWYFVLDTSAAAAMCVKYTATTCPAGFWGDTATKACVPCAGGKWGPLGGQTTEAAACTGSCPAGTTSTLTGRTTKVAAECSPLKPTFVIDGTGMKFVYNPSWVASPSGAAQPPADECIATVGSNGALGGTQPGTSATITITKPGSLYLLGQQFSTTAPSGTVAGDILTIKGYAYSGVTGPAPGGLVVAVNETFTWAADGSSQSTTGFVLCMCDTAMSAPVTSAPTAAPTTSGATPGGGTPAGPTTNLFSFRGVQQTGSCGAYTLNTCPPGTWGESSTSRCVPCRVSKGRVSKGIPNTQAEADACEDKAFVITGSGIEYGTDTALSPVVPDTCITDGNGNFGAGERASVAITAPGRIYVMGSWDLNSAYQYGGTDQDYLKVGDTSYTATKPAKGAQVKGGEVMKWYTSSTVINPSWVAKAGFKLCLCGPEYTVMSAALVCEKKAVGGCPSGTWGDATTKRCVECPLGKWGPAPGEISELDSCTGDASTSCPAGEHSSGLSGATDAATGCTANAFSFLGGGVEIDTSNKMCITDGAGMYASNKAADMRVLIAGKLYFPGAFATGNIDEDYLTIGDVTYGGHSTPPSGIAVSVYEKVAWVTGKNYDQTHEGFKMCVCPTSAPYTLLLLSKCTTFSAISCPSGYWGNTASLTCQACAAGKWGSGEGKVSEADACTGACPSGKYTANVGAANEHAAECSSTFTYVGTGVHTIGDACFTDGGDWYQPNEYAEVTVRRSGSLYTTATFSTKMEMDPAATIIQVSNGGSAMSGMTMPSASAGAVATSSATAVKKRPDPVDFLLIRGTKYGGLNAPPEGLGLLAGDKIVWKSRAGMAPGFTICICDTSAPYTAVVDGKCQQFATGKCPQGHWEDAGTSRCVPCDIFMGRVSNGAEGKTSEVAACKSTAFTFRGTGVERLGDDCITDGSGKYSVSESATITVVSDGKLFSLGTFRTGDAVAPTGAMIPVFNDYLTVSGIKFAGANGPLDGMRLKAGAKLTWATGATITPSNYRYYTGFTVCVCDTDAAWKTMVGTSCKVLTATTCPADHWGDVTNQKCVKCGIFKTSLAGSTEESACKCAVGSYRDGSVCTPCLPGSSSPRESSSAAACICSNGYWGAPGTQCTACDAAAGRVAKFGVIGGLLETTSCTESAFAVSDAKHIEVTMFNCISDGEGVVGSSETGAASFTRSGHLYSTTDVDIGPTDVLTIAGTQVVTTPDAPIAVVSGDLFSWASGYGTYNQYGQVQTTNHEGFVFCFCATSTPFVIMHPVGGSIICGEYTQNTCPAGYWGDTSTCAACPAGKFSSTADAMSIAACQDCPSGKFGYETGKSSESTACRTCPPWGVNTTAPGAIACGGTTTSRWVLADRAGDSCATACLRDSGNAVQCDESRGRVVSSTSKYMSVVSAITASRGNDAPTFHTCNSYGPLAGVGYAETPGQINFCGYMNGFDTFSCGSSQTTPLSSSSVGTAVTQLCCCLGSGDSPSQACAVEANDCIGGQAFIDGQCLTCPTGQFSTQGSTACSDCGLGNYNGNGGSTACHACPFNTVTGIDFVAAKCTTCETGRVRDAAAVFCSACAAGKMKDVVADVCIDCLVHEYAPPSSEKCQTCPEGSVPDDAKAACSQCRVGTYAPHKSLACYDCGFQGMDCSGGVLKLVAGWWYAAGLEKLEGTTAVYECLNPLSCNVANGSVLVCPDNAGGALCAVCEDDYVPDANADDGSCKLCVSSLALRWTNKVLVMGLGGLLFFVIALVVLTRPVPTLKIDKFLVAVNVRVIIRRMRKKILKKLHQRERDAPNSKITRAESVKYVELVRKGKLDEVIELRRSMQAAHSLGAAAATVAATMRASGVAIEHAGEQVAHSLEANAVEGLENRLGQEDLGAEGMGEVIANATQGLSLGGAARGEGAGGGGGAGSDGAVGAAQGAQGNAAREGVAQVTGAIQDGAEDAVAQAREAAAQARQTAASARSRLQNFVVYVRSEGSRAIEEIRSMADPGSIKILMGNLQINASLNVVFEIPWPPIFTKFLAFMAVFKLDIFKGFSFAAPCLHSSHFMSLASFIATPAVLIAVFFAAYLFVSCMWTCVHCLPFCCQDCIRATPCGKYTISSARTAALKISIIIILFIYPTICSKVFMTFKCVDVGESGVYMVADMSVKCFSSQWIVWAVVAVGAMLIYVIGIPVVLLLFLWIGERRNTLQYPATQIGTVTAIQAHEVAHHVTMTNEFFNNRLAFGNLYLQYEPKFWWFEFCCTMRKMILTGALVLFGAGTAPQVVTALIVCVMWFGLVANLQPFVEDTDDRLAQVEGLQVLFTLLIGLVLQLQAERAKSGSTEDGANELGIILIVLNVAVVALAVLQQPISRKIIGAICACPHRNMMKYRAKHEWGKVKVRPVNDDDYAFDDIHQPRDWDWYDTFPETMRVLSSAPIALMEAGAQTMQQIKNSRRSSGRWGVQQRWHFDLEGNSLDKRPVKEGNVWLDTINKRFFTEQPLELVEAPSFSTATHWLDRRTGMLLDAPPALVNPNRVPLFHIHHMETLYRSRYTNELRVDNPMKKHEVPKKKKKKSCCCKKEAATVKEEDEEEDKIKSPRRRSFVAHYSEKEDGIDALQVVNQTSSNHVIITVDPTPVREVDEAYDVLRSAFRASSPRATPTAKTEAMPQTKRVNPRRSSTAQKANAVKNSVKAKASLAL